MRTFAFLPPPTGDSRACPVRGRPAAGGAGRTSLIRRLIEFGTLGGSSYGRTDKSERSRVDPRSATYCTGNWMNWYSELVEDIEELLRSFLSELLDEAEIPDHTILICQLGLKQGGLGLLHPASRAVSDFIVSMNKAQFSARN
ncbi:hypothetical protein THAOC_27746, partial [Thalassiosira oceanica]